MKNTEYITICGWMVNELHLSGTELITYAIIYGYSQNPNCGSFYGSAEHLAECCNCEVHTIYNCLKKLTAKKYIHKISNSDNPYKKLYKYYINQNLLKDKGIF